MKNKLFILLFFTLLLTGSCQQELEDRYLNPDKTGNPSIDKIFTRMLDDNRVRPSYWEISTFVNWHIGVYTQSVGFLNSDFIYQQNEQYIQERWDDFYRPSANGAGIVAHFREMEKLFNAMSPEEQKKWEVFLQAGRIILYDNAMKMVDLWGSIPLSEAGMLNETGELVYPKFDPAAQIYQEANLTLKSAAMYFRNTTAADLSHTLFSSQDILLWGDGQKWRRYANSLRLRLLMRTSFVEEETSRTEVMDMLSDESTYPLLNSEGYVSGTGDVLLSPLVNYTDDLHAAFTDWTNYPAPYFMLEQVMKPVADPRIGVMFDKYGEVVNNTFVPNTVYNSMPLTLTRIEQQQAIGKYAILDSATFLYNAKLPGVVMTAAEVDFLKAEAYERWGGGDAAYFYEQGIRHSIAFYFYLNSLNVLTRQPLIQPSDQDLEVFFGNPVIQYQGTAQQKLKKIWTQKWVHFGFLQTTSGWAELRRTNFPALSFFPSSLAGYELPPSRLTYPAREKAYNPLYSEVARTDSRTERIFWDVD